MFFGKYYTNWLIDERECKLTYYRDGDKWNTFANHQLVGEYLGTDLAERRGHMVGDA